MNEASRKSEEPNLPGFDAPISSPGSAAGISPSVSPDGGTTKSGPAPALASPTAPPASKKETPTSATSGPTSSGSSRSAALNTSLANRLRARLSTVGSIEYKQTWKELVTPSGTPYWAHTASARTIYVNVSTGALLSPVPTPAARDWKNAGLKESAVARKENGHAQPLTEIAQLAAFNTPRATDGSNGGPNQANGALSADVALAAWPKTPAACDGEGGTFDVMKALRENLNPKAKLRDWALVAGFPTAKVTDTHGDKPHGQGGQGLHTVAQMASWNTMSVEDAARDGSLEGWMKYVNNGQTSQSRLRNQVHTAIRGEILDLFFVPTGRRVVLAPEFSLWLMGFPEAWVTAAPGAKDWLEAQAALALEYSKDPATPSSPSSPPSSSAPS